MVMALRMLTALARGETPDPSRMKDTVPADQLEAALGKANAELIEALDTVDLRKTISLPRGPRGPWTRRPGCTAAGEHFQNAATGRNSADDRFRSLVRPGTAVDRERQI